MYKICRAIAKIALLLLLITAAQKVSANINVIDFTKVNYPSSLQARIDYLRNNDVIYNHWVHTWKDTTAKNEAIGNLTFLYSEIDKIQNKNVETDLLLGDIAHYLYNMEVEIYYQKAVDNYKKAIAIAPKDYRVYWFLGNHYALSAVPVLAIKSFRDALGCLPPALVNTLFWSEYANACVNASMPSTAKYAAHQVSLAVGKREKIENDIINTTRGILKAVPVDTTIKANNLWDFGGKDNNRLLTFNNRLLGFKIAIDSSWNVGFGDYQNKTSYVTLQPHKAIAKNGQAIGYTMLVMIKLAAQDQSLQQFLDVFTAKYTTRQPITFNVSGINNCMAYEIKDPALYANAGGSHNYAIAIERTEPEYPGMLLETPTPLPKSDGKAVTYYRATQKYTRVKEKLYYLILLDTCEDIHAESLAVFKDFLQHVTIE